MHNQINHRIGSPTERVKSATQNLQTARASATIAALRAASAHQLPAQAVDRAATLHERLVNAGHGDVNQHRRRAADVNGQLVEVEGTIANSRCSTWASHLRSSRPSGAR